MSRLLINSGNIEKKLPFTPRDLASGFGMGIEFSAYGKVFLFVGTVTEHNAEVPALVISDWSPGHSEGKANSQFIRSVASHATHAVAPSAFHPTENSHTDERHPAYAIFDPQEIINMLEQIREHSESEKLARVLEELAEKATAQISGFTF